MKKMLVAFLCAALAFTPLMALAETMYVVTTHSDESIYMYTKPDYNDGQIVTAVPGGAAVNVITVMADVPWVQAEYSGFSGYIALESLSETQPGGGISIPPSGPVIQTMFVTSHDGGGVHLRTAPTAEDDNNIITTVPYGEPVGVIMIMADVPWAEIEYDGSVGYMMLEYLTGRQPGAHVNTSPATPAGGSDLETALGAMFQGFVPGAHEAVVVPAQGETYVNLRWAPSLSAPVRGEYGTGAPLRVYSSNGTWSEVYDEALGIHGYMETVFLQQ